MLLLKYAPEALLTRDWDPSDMTGPYGTGQCAVLVGAINFINSGKYDEVFGVVDHFSTTLSSERQTDELQYTMVREFARFKLGDKESLDMAIEMARWIDDQICKPSVVDTNGEGSLHRYILGKWGTRCPLSNAFPAPK